MSQMVKCNVCGKAFNDRYVNSHKRLAHDTHAKRNTLQLSELEVMQEILALYERLSEEKKKELQVQLETTYARN